VAALLADALETSGRQALGVRARQAFEAALEPAAGDLLLAITHEAETPATLAAVRATPGGLRATITANAAGSVTTAADGAIVTPLIDRSWCHTVGYVSPIAVGARLAAAVAGRSTDREMLATAMRRVIDLRPGIEHAARALAGASSFVVCGSGIDEVAA